MATDIIKEQSEKMLDVSDKKTRDTLNKDEDEEITVKEREKIKKDRLKELRDRVKEPSETPDEDPLASLDAYADDAGADAEGQASYMDRVLAKKEAVQKDIDNTQGGLASLVQNDQDLMIMMGNAVFEMTLEEFETALNAFSRECDD